MNTSMPQPNDMLHAWIDGELDPALETQFFSLLASDSDLREKLRHMRNIRIEAHKFGATVQPPAEISDRVFARLGFAAPASTAAASHRPALLATFERAWAPVASAAAAAVITAILILGLRNPMNEAATQSLADSRTASPAERTETPSSDGRATNDEHVFTDNTARIPSAVSDNARLSEAQSGPASHRNMRTDGTVRTSAPDGTRDENPLTTERNAETESQDRPMHTGAIEEQSFSDIAVQGDDAGNASASNATSTPSRSGSDNLAASYTDSGSDGEPTGVSSAPPSWRNPTAETTATAPAAHAMRESPASAGSAPVDTRQYFPALRPSDILPALSVELRGMNTASFPSPTISTSSDPWMQNMAVAVFYTSGQQDLGIEFGQEPFAMHYHGVENGKAVRYEQNLLTPWLLASWRHRFRPISVAGIEPYLTASLGSSLYFWPMARTGAGLMYMPDRRVRFHIGVEGSMLAYPYQQQWFTSRRVGLTYGLSVLF